MSKPIDKDIKVADLNKEKYCVSVLPDDDDIVKEANERMALEILYLPMDY